ncbi:MAG: hypothetical protein FWF15_07880 [Oscillospiraceae bacterium]|nr:hypothetical protein [Oscillospiraceae bacterium]
MLKKFIAIVLTVLMFMSISIPVFAADVDFSITSKQVTFENKAVDDYVREYLGIKTKKGLTISDCLKVKEFIVTKTDVLKNLNDIKYFPNLETFVIIDQNYIIDISALANCKNLIEVGIIACTVSDVSVLSKLQNLEYVTLMETPVSDASAIFSLPNLKYFNATGTYIYDISALKDNKTLEIFVLESSRLTDISVLKNMKSLKYLYLMEANLSGSQLEGLKTLNLKGLGLLYMDLTNDDMKYIKTLRNLEWLDLTGNDITNFNFLNSFKNLQDFYYLDLYSDYNALYNFEIKPYIELFISLLSGEIPNWEIFIQSSIWELNRPYIQDYTIELLNSSFLSMFDYLGIEEVNYILGILTFINALGVETLGDLMEILNLLDFLDFDIESFNDLIYIISMFAFVF